MRNYFVRVELKFNRRGYDYRLLDEAMRRRGFVGGGGGVIRSHADFRFNTKGSVDDVTDLAFEAVRSFCTGNARVIAVAA